MDRVAPTDPPSPEPVLRTVIVDDHELLRAGTRGILDEADGFTVVGEAADADEARMVVADTAPDLVITDIRMPTSNGIDLAGQLVDEHPGLLVVILSAYDDEHYVRAALAAGVSGYLLKTLPSHELVAALRDACSGAQQSRRAQRDRNHARDREPPPMSSAHPPHVADATSAGPGREHGDIRRGDVRRRPLKGAT